jgi:hypothetical protein
MKRILSSQIKLCRKVKAYNTALQKMYAAIKLLQSECKHELARKKYGSNTGNYDPHSDCYWTDFYCPICDKRWSVDGSSHIEAVETPHGKELDCKMLTAEQLEFKIIA